MDTSILPTPDTCLSELMRLAQEGDSEAYRALLRLVAAILRRKFARRVGQPEVVDDILQETLISIDAARHTYDPSRPFGAWMNALAANRLADHWRRTSRIAEHEVRDELAVNNAIDPESDDRAFDGQLSVEEILAELPEEQRRLLLLVKKDGLSVREASGLLGISESAAKVRVHRAIQVLKGKFRKAPGEKGK